MTASGQNELKRIVRFMRVIFIIVLVSITAIVFLVPFGVDLGLLYDEQQGNLTLVDEFGTRIEIEDEVEGLTIEPGDEIVLPAQARGRVHLIPELGAYAYLFGPVAWEVRAAERHATAFAHVIQPREADYALEIAQSAGSVVYDFSASDISLANINLLIRAGDQIFEPDVPCFQVFAPQNDQPGRLAPIPCGEDDQPPPMPALPG